MLRGSSARWGQTEHKTTGAFIEHPQNPRADNLPNLVLKGGWGGVETTDQPVGPADNLDPKELGVNGFVTFSSSCGEGSVQVGPHR
jgi:hypothetical protein